MTSVHRITRYGFINAYLIEDADGLTVVDTGVGGGAAAILRAAQRLGRPIVRIVLTHGHGDHVGSLDQLAAQLPQVAVLISERDAPLLERDRSARPGEPEDARMRGSLPGTRTRPTGFLRDGDRVGALEVVASPGHTPGHCSLLDTRDRTLYCGDAYTTIGGVATTARGPFWFPLASRATWHAPTALASARRLRALEPTQLAAGHGRVVEAPADAMDRAIARGA